MGAETLRELALSEAKGLRAPLSLIGDPNRFCERLYLELRISTTHGITRMIARMPPPMVAVDSRTCRRAGIKGTGAIFRWTNPFGPIKKIVVDAA